MAGRRSCIYCGETVSVNGYCRSCGLGQSFLWKAGNTSLYYYNIALDKAGVRDLSGAIESLKMSLRYNKSNTDARNLLGLIYYEMGETVSALSAWVISVNYKPKDNIAVRYLKELRDDPETLNKANEAARLFNKGLELATSHDFDLAVIQLRKCITINPNFVKAYLLLSLISNAQNRTGVAKKYITRVIAIDRGNPDALDFLREMGESDADINRLAEEGMNTDNDLFDYYGMEQSKGRRPARKIVPAEREKARSLRLKRYKEQSLSRLSNIYMIVGILIGLAVFYFLMAPAIKSDYDEKLRESETSFNQSISAKNSEIDNLKQELESVSSKNNDYESKQSTMQKTIDNLNAEVETLKRTVESGGLNAAAEQQESDKIKTSSTGVTLDPNAEETVNSAADRNNANVIGISGPSIEDIISNE
ncbi:MAG: hypothetical protein K6B68_11905 [Eubacterium sp.]|nr:hypothetical protein [Eubacterium sp.]